MNDPIPRRRFLAAGLLGVMAAALPVRPRRAAAAIPGVPGGVLEVDCPALDPVDIGRWFGARDAVNSGPFLGAPPGTVRLARTCLTRSVDVLGHCRVTRTYEFHVKPDGWNNFLDPNTDRPRPVLFDGRPAYPSSDFDRLPGIRTPLASRLRPA